MAWHRVSGVLKASTWEGSKMDCKAFYDRLEVGDTVVWTHPDEHCTKTARENVEVVEKLPIVVAPCARRPVGDRGDFRPVHVPDSDWLVRIRTKDGTEENVRIAELTPCE